MKLTYLDTSAAMKLIVDEAESAALVAELAGSSDRQLVASWLLHTELHCAAGRNPAAIPLASVETVLNTVTLVELSRGDLIAAGGHAPLRSNDAIHLAVAVRLGVDELATYDQELSNATKNLGMAVIQPR